MLPVGAAPGRTAVLRTRDLDPLLLDFKADCARVRGSVVVSADIDIIASANSASHNMTYVSRIELALYK